MEHNFWYWLIINALEYIVRRFLPLLPAHENWDVAGAVLLYGGELATILFVFMGQFIALGTLMRITAIILFLELWKQKGKVLKVIGLLRFFV